LLLRFQKQVCKPSSLLERAVLQNYQEVVDEPVPQDVLDLIARISKLS